MSFRRGGRPWAPAGARCRGTRLFISISSLVQGDGEGHLCVKAILYLRDVSVKLVRLTDFDSIEVRCAHALCRAQLASQPGLEIAWLLLRPEQTRDEQLQTPERMLRPLWVGIRATDRLHTVVHGSQAGGKPYFLRSCLCEGSVPWNDVSEYCPDFHVSQLDHQNFPRLDGFPPRILT